MSSPSASWVWGGSNLNEKLNILLATSEVVGFAKTGGLADVCAALPQAMARRGHRASIILPLYRSARQAKPAPVPTERQFTVVVGQKVVETRLWHTTLDDGVTVWLVEQNDYFDRDDPTQGRGIYQYTRHDGSRADYEDNCERFVFFNRAVLEALPLLDAWPDILHVNDWQTGLIPVYLKEQYLHRMGESGPLGYDRLGTLLTIHNIAYQGTFWHWDMKLAGLDWRLFNPRQLEFYGKLSFLKAGIVYADLLNTVSPTYAREIQTPYFGYGMQGVLWENRDRLFGIVNGVDYRVWDPAIDRHLPANYSLDDLSGKAICKAALQREFAIAEDAAAPLCGVVARLTEQKGVDLITAVAPGILDAGGQLVVLGEGDRKYHHVLQHLRDRYPNRMGIYLGFHEAKAHRVEAGADFFLMPSAFEPSGLNQLYSLKYGTPPVVRATGGLADTVTDASPENLANGTATGFRFGGYSAHECWRAVERAIGMYRHYPEFWRQLMRTGMSQDWSWDRSAAEYEQLYQRLRKPR